MYCVRSRVNRACGGLRLLSVATAVGTLMFAPDVNLGGAALAQNAGQQTTQPSDQAGTTLPAGDPGAAPGAVTGLIAANAAKPGTICPAISPVIMAAPAAFSELVEASKTFPDLLEPLGECCAVIQKSLKTSNPEGAKTVSNILVSGPPAIQAACAVSLAEAGGSAPAQTALASSSGSGDGGTGTTGVGFGGGSGGGGTFGGGGGTVSAASP
jgi:uncharacterized membrane protein YgcG